MSCKYCDGSGIGFGASANDLCVFENHDKPELVIPLGNSSVRAHIDYCPRCGRNLRGDSKKQEKREYEFPHHLDIPVPMGGTVWSFWTDCCCACYTKKERPAELRCDFQAPCHTYITSVQPVILKFNNLGMILEQWGKRFFYTKSDAEDAANELINKHRARMRELGYDLDSEGRIIDFERKIDDDE